jgi:hypothetical protein
LGELLLELLEEMQFVHQAFPQHELLEEWRLVHLVLQQEMWLVP